MNCFSFYCNVLLGDSRYPFFIFWSELAFFYVSNRFQSKCRMPIDQTRQRKATLSPTVENKSTLNQLICFIYSPLLDSGVSMISQAEGGFSSNSLPSGRKEGSNSR